MRVLKFILAAELSIQAGFIVFGLEKRQSFYEEIDQKTSFLMQIDELQGDQKLIAHDIRYTECQAKQIEKQYKIKIPDGSITPNTGTWI